MYITHFNSGKMSGFYSVKQNVTSMRESSSKVHNSYIVIYEIKYICH